MATELHADWGRRLEQQRTQRGLSRADLARDAGVTRQHIHLIEAGKVAPSDGVRIRIAAALHVEVSEIFSYPTREAS